MTAEQWRQAWEIFQAAQNEPDRDAFVAGRTNDAAVIARVTAMFEQEDEEAEPVHRERTAGERFGRYVIDERIGSGSYGEVWSGQDTELGRRVALKFISRERQGDHDAARRLLREARAASALNHPHIVVVHEVIASESGPVIVMELVDGAPLRSMMNADKANPILVQVLKALAFAHAAGIVHRDLKPENIAVRPDGFVKVLDFGLARQAADTSTNASASAGLSLGTLRYMAPEQCRGEAATPASDVFAAGVIFYELLAGKHPFESGSWIDTVNAIVKSEPKPLQDPAWALIAKMLSKAPADRPSAWEAARLLEPGASPVAKRWNRWAIGAAVAGAALIAFFAITPTREQNVRQTDTRLDLGAGTFIDERNFALSPDGRKVLFHSRGSLHVLDLAGGPAVELKGLAGENPFWSPDGSEIGYFAGGKLWRKGFPDGPAREICDAPNMSSAHWGSNDIILFASSSDAPIARVSAGGGNPVPVVQFEPGAKRNEAPFLLPDGRHFVYWSANNRRIGDLKLGDLDGQEPPRQLARTASSAIYLPRPGSTVGALVYRASGGLMLMPFDSATNQITGAARTIAERTSRVNHKIVPASASARGDLVYREADDRRVQVKIFDRHGQLLAKVAEPKEYTAAVPSPDFQRLALLSENPVTGQRDLEIFDFQTQRTTLVPEAVASGNPTWSPDGATLIAGNGSVSGGADFYRISISAAGSPGVSMIPWKEKSAAWPSGWAIDSKNVVLVVDDSRTDFDIWMLPMDGRGEPRPVIATPAREQRASLSPDGKLLLYMSDESKTSEIWVTPNPPDGRKWKVSTGGGQEPKWRGDGKEIFYQSMDYALMSVRVGGTPGQPSFTKPELLFGGRSSDPALMVWHCEPSADGQRFVILTGLIQNTAAPLRLRLNWWAEGR